MKASQKRKNSVLKDSFAEAKLKGMDSLDLPATTILTGLKPGIAAWHEKLFGPVASFYVVKDEKAAIDLANDSDFTLGASIFIQNNERGKKAAGQNDTYKVFINHPTWAQAGIPSGETSDSGFGHELSELEIHAFVNKKLIRISELNDAF